MIRRCINSSLVTIVAHGIKWIGGGGRLVFVDPRKPGVAVRFLVVADHTIILTRTLVWGHTISPVRMDTGKRFVSEDSWEDIATNNFKSAYSKNIIWIIDYSEEIKITSSVRNLAGELAASISE